MYLLLFAIAKAIFLTAFSVFAACATTLDEWKMWQVFACDAVKKFFSLLLLRRMWKYSLGWWNVIIIIIFRLQTFRKVSQNTLCLIFVEFNTLPLLGISIESMSFMQCSNLGTKNLKYLTCPIHGIISLQNMFSSFYLIPTGTDRYYHVINIKFKWLRTQREKGPATQLRWLRKWLKLKWFLSIKYFKLPKTFSCHFHFKSIIIYFTFVSHFDPRSFSGCVLTNASILFHHPANDCIQNCSSGGVFLINWLKRVSPNFKC